MDGCKTSQLGTNCVFVLMEVDYPVSFQIERVIELEFAPQGLLAMA
jgi:hypothetical protein